MHRRHSGSRENGPLHTEVCRGKDFHLSLQKALINQRKLKDQYKGAGTSGRDVREWGVMLKGGEESLQLTGDELASGMQCNELGNVRGCFASGFNAEHVPIKGEVGAAMRHRHHLHRGRWACAWGSCLDFTSCKFLLELMLQGMN